MSASFWAVLRRWVTGEYARTVLIVALATGPLVLFRPELQITDVAMLYLLPVVVAAGRYHRGSAVLATALCIALFDFLFVPPYYSFSVGESAYLLTFVVMCVVALVMSGLTARIREQREEADARERRTAALYAMSIDLAQVAHRPEMVAIVARHLGLATRASVTVVLADEAALESDAPRWPDGPLFENIFVRLAAAWSYRSGRPSGSGTSHASEAEALVLPLRGAARVLGVVVAAPEPEGRTFLPEEIATAELLADRAGLEFERLLLAEKHERRTTVER